MISSRQAQLLLRSLKMGAVRQSTARAWDTCDSFGCLNHLDRSWVGRRPTTSNLAQAPYHRFPPFSETRAMAKTSRVLGLLVVAALFYVLVPTPSFTGNQGPRTSLNAGVRPGLRRPCTARFAVGIFYATQTPFCKFRSKLFLTCSYVFFLVGRSCKGLQGFVHLV